MKRRHERDQQRPMRIKFPHLPKLKGTSLQGQPSSTALAGTVLRAMPPAELETGFRIALGPPVPRPTSGLW